MLLLNIPSPQVIVHAGPRLSRALPFGPVPAKSLKVEYSSLECAVEVVDGVDDAIRHILAHGSSHTDAIVTDNGKIMISKLINKVKIADNKT